jgi:mutator protein MutT
MGYRTTIGVRALVIQNDRVLLVRHSYIPQWYHVGGAVEKGETPLQAIQRELMEEAGIQCLERPKLFSIYYSCREKRDDYIIFYIVQNVEQKISQSFEIEEHRWFNLSKLPDDISPATKRRIEEYREERLLTEHW